MLFNHGTKTVYLGFGHSLKDSMNLNVDLARVDVCVSVAQARISALGRGASLSFVDCLVFFAVASASVA